MGNNKMVKAIPLLGLAGMITAYYAYHVESKLHDPFYKPVCETSWGSCATVFRSSYAHLVSHFGIVPPGHALDLSLAESGMIIYAVYCLYPTFLFKRFVPYPQHVLLLIERGMLHVFLPPLRAQVRTTGFLYCVHHIPRHQFFDVLLRRSRVPQVSKLRSSSCCKRGIRITPRK